MMSQGVAPNAVAAVDEARQWDRLMQMARLGAIAGEGVNRAALTDRADAAKWQRAAAGAKAFIGENVDAIAREAVQMHGGMGITDELAIGHALKRVLVLARLFGDVDTVLAEYALAA